MTHNAHCVAWAVLHYFDAKGVTPTRREIMRLTGIRSCGTVDTAIRELRAANYLPEADRSARNFSPVRIRRYFEIYGPQRDEWRKPNETEGDEMKRETNTLATVEVIFNSPVDREARTAHAEAGRLIEQELRSLEYRGNWQLRPMVRGRMRAGAGIRLSHVKGRAVHLRVRAGNNASCWECDLIPPVNYETETVFEALNAKHGRADGDENEVVAVAEPPKQNGHPVALTEEFRKAADTEAATPITTAAPKTEPAKLDGAAFAGGAALSILREVGAMEEAIRRDDDRKRRRDEVAATLEELRAERARVDQEIKAAEDEFLRLEMESDADETAKSAREVAATLAKLFGRGRG